MIHKPHPLYGEFVCGQLARDEDGDTNTDTTTCLTCATWQPWPLRPTGPFTKTSPAVPHHVAAHNSFEASKRGDHGALVVGRMVAPEDLTITTVEHYVNDRLYAVDTLGRRWPLDLPPVVSVP